MSCNTRKSATILTRAYAAQFGSAPTIIDAGVCGLFQRRLSLLPSYTGLCVRRFLRYLQLHFHQSWDIYGCVQVPIPMLLSVVHDLHTQAQLALDASFANFMDSVYSFGEPSAAPTRCLGQIFPYVHQVSSSEGRSVKRDRLLHRLQHALDEYRRRASVPPSVSAP
jgi:hypothetical protein